MSRALERSIASSLRLSSRFQRENITKTIVLARFKSSKASKETPKSNTTPSPSVTPNTLTWSEYLAIRANRRRWQNAMSVPTSLIGLFGGASYFGSLDTDAASPIFGIDPFMFYGMCTAACMGFGFLLGPSLGNAIWRFSHRRFGDLIDSRDRSFYEHIQKRRVDASLQSPTAPVPDYYGEKIGSLHQYRQWLRDQGKYKRKAVLPED